MTATPTPNRPDTPVWRRPRHIVIFCLVAAALLTADLTLKWWAFQVFPPVPVDVPRTLEHARELQRRRGGGLAQHIRLPQRTVQLAPSVLNIRLVLNLGAVFGIGQGKTWLFVVITVVAVGVIAYALLTTDRRDRLQQLLLAMILAGALGNLYDRIAFGAVRDMLHLFPGVRLPFGWTWPNGSPELYPWVFNLADVYLTCGILLVVLRALLPRRHAPDAAGQDG